MVEDREPVQIVMPKKLYKYLEDVCAFFELDAEEYLAYLLEENLRCDLDPSEGGSHLMEWIQDAIWKAIGWKVEFPKTPEL